MESCTYRTLVDRGWSVVDRGWSVIDTGWSVVHSVHALVIVRLLFSPFCCLGFHAALVLTFLFLLQQSSDHIRCLGTLNGRCLRQVSKGSTQLIILLIASFEDRICLIGCFHANKAVERIDINNLKIFLRDHPSVLLRYAFC
eukprot:GHVQ01001233.1.p1 GENE.GHVQ01001233.1~~GHVQ01001233.1.p1  ORF type:complete len:142 (-),score=2.61 GHVQ01001233.1:430-855(-)